MQVNWLPWLLLACIPEIEKPSDILQFDIDQDGWTVEEGDCWESSAQPRKIEGALGHVLTSADIHPGAIDVWYDGIDQNCDGFDDFDQDGDGYVPQEYEGVETFGVDNSGLRPAGDCNDTQPLVFPQANETPADDVDSDCDGFELCFQDLDLDEVGTNQVVLGDVFCSEDGVSSSSTDCDDDDALNRPGLEEVCDGLDNNCDLEISLGEMDQDQDGFVSCSIVESGWRGVDSIIGGGDCDDTNATYFPGQTWYFDADGDGYGQETLESHVFQSCEPDGLYSALYSGDCAPSDPEIYPNATEDGDYTDNNCDEMEEDGYVCSGERRGQAYFIMCPFPMSAVNAQMICLEYGYDGLASIADPYENLMLLNLNSFLGNGVWLGADDNRIEDQFVWSDGLAFSYSRWAVGHPSSGGVTANCVTMNTSGDWLEVSCNQQFTGFSCSRRW